MSRAVSCFQVSREFDGSAKCCTNRTVDAPRHCSIRRALRLARLCGLAGVVPSDALDAIFLPAGRLASLPELDRRDAAAARFAAARLLEMTIWLADSDEKLAVLSMERAASVVSNIFSALDLSEMPPLANEAVARAAHAAARIAERADLLDGEAASAALEAAANDYAVLVDRFGVHDAIVLGEPIDMAAEWWPTAI